MSLNISFRDSFLVTNYGKGGGGATKREGGGACEVSSYEKEGGKKKF